MKKRLALNIDGVITYCSSTPETFGTGRCNHVIHQKDEESNESFLERANDQNLKLNDKEAVVETSLDRFIQRRGWFKQPNQQERNKLLDKEQEYYDLQYKKLIYKLDIMNGKEPDPKILPFMSQEELDADLTREDIARLGDELEKKEFNLQDRREMFDDKYFEQSIKELNPKKKQDKQKLLGYWESDNYKVALMASDRLEHALAQPYVVNLFQEAANRPYQQLADYELKRIDTWLGNGTLDPNDDTAYSDFISQFYISSKQEEEVKEKYPNIYEVEQQYHPDFVLDDRL